MHIEKASRLVAKKDDQVAVLWITRREGSHGALDSHEATVVPGTKTIRPTMLCLPDYIKSA